MADKTPNQDKPAIQQPAAAKKPSSLGGIFHRPAPAGAQPDAPQKQKIYTLTCRRCNEEVSGPDIANVKATMLKHQVKKGHLLVKKRVSGGGQAAAGVSAPAAPPVAGPVTAPQKDAPAK